MTHHAHPVTVVITCTLKPEQRVFAMRELEAVIRQVMRHEPACQGIRVHHDPKNPDRLLIVERWASEEAFSGPHMQQPHMQAFMKTAETFLDGQAEFGFWHETLVG